MGVFCNFSTLKRRAWAWGSVCICGNTRREFLILVMEMNSSDHLRITGANTATKIGQSPILWWGLCNDGDWSGIPLMHQRRRPKNLLLQKNGPLFDPLDDHTRTGWPRNSNYEILEEARKRIDCADAVLVCWWRRPHFRCFYLYRQTPDWVIG